MKKLLATLLLGMGLAFGGLNAVAQTTEAPAAVTAPADARRPLQPKPHPLQTPQPLKRPLLRWPLKRLPQKKPNPPSTRAMWPG
jgi:hypothetical protein